MSRGLGSMQRRILTALESLRDDVPPLFWYEKQALGIGPSASEGSSFRRAASSLKSLGLIEVFYADRESQRLSASSHYKGNRPGAVDDDKTYQGSRILLLVRLTPTEEDRRSRAQIEESLSRAHRSPRSTWGKGYINWYYFGMPTGVWNDEFVVDTDPLDDDDIAELQRLLLGRQLPVKSQ